MNQFLGRWIVVLLFGILVMGCRRQELPLTAVSTPSPQTVPTQIAQATAVSSPTSTTTSTPTDTAVPTSTTHAVYLPLTHSEANTPTPTATSTPTITPTPGPPTATPTPNYPIHTGAPLKRSDIGIQLYIHRQNMPDLARELQALDVGWIKMQVSWKLFEPAPEQYDSDRFEDLDSIISIAAENNIAVMLSVSKAPEWSRPTTEEDGPPSDYGRYQAFMTHLAQRYAGRVAAYELWNEPNLQREWRGSPLSAADFVRLMRAGAAGVRAVDGDVILISGAPATTGINDGTTAIDDRQYLRQMLAAGVANVVDVIGAHPYGWANPPDSSVTSPDTNIPSHNNHPSFFFANTLHDYAALLDEFGVSQMPIWVTEFGWGSFDNLESDPPTGVEYMNNVSEWQQAVYTLRAYQLADEWDSVGPMMLWNLNFASVLGNQFSESGYSLLNTHASRRPVFEMLVHLPKE